MAFSPAASATTTGYAEPVYTKTAGNNSFWWQWQAVNGYDSNTNTNYTYYLCFNTFQNGIKIESSNGTNGPGTQNCTGSLRSGPTPSSGNYGALPLTSGTVLTDGAAYSMCAAGFRLQYTVWTQVGINECPSTRIDRNKPALGVSLGNGAAVTRNANIPVAISYNDATSPPWFGSNGYASNWVCISTSNCTPTGQPNNNCSAPNSGFSNRINSFSCSMNITAGDGSYHFCTYGADAAVPDNPNGTNQFASAFSNNANLSTTACDSIILDRAGPTVNVTASATSVTVGDLVSFSASASDPNGLSGQPAWTFGDNTAGSSGGTATHTYTQPGTYVVKATQADAAGNVGEGTRTITVNSAPTNDGGGGNTGGNTGGDTGGETGGNTGGDNGATTPGTTQGTTGAIPFTGGRTPEQHVGQQGGGTSTVSVGALDVIAPKRFKAGKRRMLLAFTAETAGKLNVTFLRGAKVVARKGAVFGGPGTYTVRLKVPKKLKPGRYKLKVTFTPAGSSKATTRTLKVAVKGKKKRRSRGKVIVPARLDGTSASRAKRPKAVDPRKVDRTITVR